MDATVEAAIIGAVSAGGTGVIVGALGILGTLLAAKRGGEAGLQAARESADRSANATLEATRVSTEANLEATRTTLAAAQAARLWEERSRVYVDIVGEVMQRQVVRHWRLKDDSNAYSVFGEHLLKLTSLDDPRRYFLTIARVATLGSDVVFAAFEAAREANEVVFHIDAEGKPTAEGATADGPEAANALFDARRQAALKAASEADIALIQTVRDELNAVLQPRNQRPDQQDPEHARNDQAGHGHVI